MMPKVVLYVGPTLTVYQAEQCLGTLRDHGVGDSWMIRIDEAAQSITAHPPEIEKAPAATEPPELEGEGGS